MNRFGDMTVSEIAKALGKYRPFILVVVGVLLLAVVLPGTRQAEPEEESVSATAPVTTPGATVPTGDVAAAPTDVASTPGGAATRSSGGGGAASPAARAVGGAAPRGATTQGVTTAAVTALGDPLAAPDCDKTTGRTAIPSVYAPNCVAQFPKGGDNGGATYRGITKDSVTVALYDAQESESAQAIAAAGGATDDTTPEEDDANRNLLIKAFESHFETYGRTVKWVRVPASGPEDDDAAAKADAIRVATEVKAFVSFGGPTGTNAYADELVARGVLCFCTASQPIENYLKWAPYIWSDLMSSSQGYIHRSEYVCKRLKDKNAKWAGDTVMQAQKRTFALVYYDTEDNAYRAGADFMEKLLGECGIKLAIRLATVGAHIDPTAGQEEARVYAARLKDSKATSVLFAGDPFYPIFLTKEATNQQYFPEWVITGSTLSDTAFFARLYDQNQWNHAFGISFLTARVSSDVTDAEKNLVEWHYGQSLTSYPSMTAFNRLYTGMQLAGPKLTPESFRDGLFSFKPTRNFITRFAVSYGRGLWPWDDYLAADDCAEIWWDPTSSGEDEIGTVGVGLYRYVAGGKRYLPGEWPAGEPKAFQTEGTILMFDERPAPDKDPEYQHTDQHHRSSPATG